MRTTLGSPLAASELSSPRMNATTTRTSRITVVSAHSVKMLRVGRRNKLRTPYSQGKSRRTSRIRDKEQTEKQLRQAAKEAKRKGHCRARQMKRIRAVTAEASAGKCAWTCYQELPTAAQRLAQSGAARQVPS